MASRQDVKKLERLKASREQCSVALAAVIAHGNKPDPAAQRVETRMQVAAHHS
jgi:hypothetical protein